MFRISEPFTICDPAEYERKYGLKPFPLDSVDAGPQRSNAVLCAEAAALVEENRTTLDDRTALKLEKKMEDLCDFVAMIRFTTDADKYTVVFHPTENRFWAFPIPPASNG